MSAPKKVDKLIEVKHAALHQPLQWPGVCSEKTLNATKTRGLKMFWNESYTTLLVTLKDAKGILQTATVPSSNVINAVLLCEDKASE